MFGTTFFSALVLEGETTIRRFYTLVSEYKEVFLVDQNGVITDCGDCFLYYDFLLNPLRMMNKTGIADFVAVHVISMSRAEEDGTDIINETWE